MAAVNLNQHNFREEVLNSDQKVLLDFWAPWCGPCRMFTPIIETFAKEHPEVEVGKVNVDDESELAERFGIMSVPTLVILKNGEVVKKNAGVISKEAIEELIS